MASDGINITLKELGQKKLGELTRDEMQLVIDSLKPKDQLHTGIRFLNILLKRRGPKAVVEFVEKMHQVLDKEGKLQDYDLEGYEDVFNKARLNVMSRRNFLRTLGWGVPGAIVTVSGVAKIGDQFVSYVDQKEGPSSDSGGKTNVFRQIYDWNYEHLAGAEYTIIGAALVNECVEKWREIKLDQVANAIAEFAEKHPPEPPAKEAAR